MRIVYLGGKATGADCLRILLDHVRTGDSKIVAVGAAARGGGIADIANHAGLTIIDGPDAIPECDLLISVQYDRILRARHIAKAAAIAVNLHYAPLPEYRGCNQFSLAILEGRQEFGVTLHEIDEGIDSGDILFESRFAVPQDIWVDQLHLLACEKARELFDTSVPKLIAGDYRRRPQSELFETRGEPRHSFRKEIDSLKQIDLTVGRDDIERRIRATAMPGFDPPYATVAGQRIELVRKSD